MGYVCSKCLHSKEKGQRKRVETNEKGEVKEGVVKRKKKRKMQGKWPMKKRKRDRETLRVRNWWDEENKIVKKEEGKEGDVVKIVEGEQEEKLFQKIKGFWRKVDEDQCLATRAKLEKRGVEEEREKVKIKRFKAFENKEKSKMGKRGAEKSSFYSESADKAKQVSSRASKSRRSGLKSTMIKRPVKVPRLNIQKTKNSPKKIGIRGHSDRNLSKSKHKPKSELIRSMLGSLTNRENKEPSLAQSIIIAPNSKELNLKESSGLQLESELDSKSGRQLGELGISNTVKLFNSLLQESSLSRVTENRDLDKKLKSFAKKSVDISLEIDSVRSLKLSQFISTKPLEEIQCKEGHRAKKALEKRSTIFSKTQHFEIYKPKAGKFKHPLQLSERDYGVGSKEELNNSKPLEKFNKYKGFAVIGNFLQNVKSKKAQKEKEVKGLSIREELEEI
jgi:hypothetical protein